MERSSVSHAARLGRYELLARLATGGMGEIFLARLEGAAGFEKLYVVKRILPHLADDARFRSMLIAEARVASKMSHANICQVYELDETDGQLYIVMEYLEGVTLLPLLRRASKQNAPFDLGFVAGLLQQTCEALHYAHELHDRNGDPMGIVHRDVTPANVFLTESGVTKVLDFGIAKVRNASTKTEDGAVKGKYAYMAPEQLRGGAIDRRVDVFALGVVLFEMLALRRLFQRKTDYLTFRAVMEQPIPDVRSYRPDAPDVLAAVVSRALERDPAARWESARAFSTAVLDAVKRPWTQGEIGDFVRQNFDEEIKRRSEQVHQAIARTTNTRQTMPLIAQQPVTPDDDDEAEFPSVETDAGPYQPPPTQPGDFSGSTPPPFGAESTGNHLLEPLRGREEVGRAPVVMVRPRSSLLWPLVAIAMVGITAAALFLVWKQTQQAQVPTSVVIEQHPDPRVGSSVVQPVDPPVGSAVDPPGGGGAEPRKPPRPPPVVDYNKPVKARQSELAECVAKHGALPKEAMAAIDIDTKGRATVGLQPTTLDATMLGTCIRKVLENVSFPTGQTHRLNLRLH
jgi:serine/threonine protein kinase